MGFLNLESVWIKGILFSTKPRHPGSDAYLHGRSSESTGWRVVQVLKILELDHQWQKRRESREHPIKGWEPALILPTCNDNQITIMRAMLGIGNTSCSSVRAFIVAVIMLLNSWFSSLFSWLHIDCLKGQCGLVHWCIWTLGSWQMHSRKHELNEWMNEFPYMDYDTRTDISTFCLMDRLPCTQLSPWALHLY